MFDEEDHRQPVPSFRLADLRGGTIGLENFSEKYNLALLFLHGLDCAACQKALAVSAANYREFRQQDAKILAIISRPPRNEKEDSIVENLPFPVLLDDQGHVRRSFAQLLDERLVSGDDVLLYVLDHYGAPYAVLVDKEFKSGALENDVIKWLEYIEIQCPE
jgi:peroxiredoxin